MTQRSDFQGSDPNANTQNMKAGSSVLSSLFPKAPPSSTPQSPDGLASLPTDSPDVADTGLADVGPPAPDPPIMSGIPLGRPQFQRNQSQPPPPNQPPPPPAPQQIGNPNDSLSLMQLRRIVNEFPKAEALTYAFEYKDTATFEEEINEWFSYNPAEFKRLIRAKDTFQRRWKKGSKQSWLDAKQTEQQEFVRAEVNELHSEQLRRRCKGLQSLLHIVLGVWDETAGLRVDTFESKGKEASRDEEVDNSTFNGDLQESVDRLKATEPQCEHIRLGIELFSAAGGIPLLFQVMQDAFKRLWYVTCQPDFSMSKLTTHRDDEFRETQLAQEDIPYIQDELDNVTTIMYLIIEVVRKYPDVLEDVRSKLCKPLDNTSKTPTNIPSGIETWLG